MSLALDSSSAKDGGIARCKILPKAALLEMGCVRSINETSVN
ncbi:hypothetical protein [Microcoleus sp. bin38.metabat.b11b12b14.051]|nr:hypothetical protein [Microcoleus sp. bin38.metabat.b11b12b14.051]